MDFSGFDWDEGNLAKCAKHGVSRNLIEALFQSGLMVLPDAAHSKRESRFKGIGRTDDGRYVFVVFTLRRRTASLLIRPISARYMHRKEVSHYVQSYKDKEGSGIPE